MKNSPRLWAVVHAHMRFLCLISYVWAFKNVELASHITDWCIEKIGRDINQLTTHNENEKKKKKNKRNSKHDEKKWLSNKETTTHPQSYSLNHFFRILNNQSTNPDKFYSLNHFFRILNNQSTNPRYTWKTSVGSSLWK